MNVTRYSLSQLRIHNRGFKGWSTPASLTSAGREGMVIEYSGYIDNPLAVDLGISRVLVGSTYCRILAKHAWRPHDYC